MLACCELTFFSKRLRANDIQIVNENVAALQQGFQSSVDKVYLLVTEFRLESVLGFYPWPLQMAEHHSGLGEYTDVGLLVLPVDFAVTAWMVFSHCFEVVQVS